MKKFRSGGVLGDNEKKLRRFMISGEGVEDVNEIGIGGKTTIWGKRN